MSSQIPQTKASQDFPKADKESHCKNSKDPITAKLPCTKHCASAFTNHKEGSRKAKSTCPDSDKQFQSQHFCQAPLIRQPPGNPKTRGMTSSIVRRLDLCCFLLQLGSFPGIGSHQRLPRLLFPTNISSSSPGCWTSGTTSGPAGHFPVEMYWWLSWWVSVPAAGCLPRVF